MILTHLFGPTSDAITWWQESLRALVIFCYGLALVRVAGRRVFGKWSALDIIVSVMVGSNLSRALTGNSPLGGTLAATTLLIVLHWVLAHLAARNRWVSKVLEGLPIGLARAGQLQTRAMLRESISQADLREALRQSGVDDVGNARLVTLEPSGKITVLKAE